MLRNSSLVLVILVLGLFVLNACGKDDDDEGTDGGDNTGPVQGEVFLSAEDGVTPYQVPVLFTNSDNGDVMILWRSNDEIFLKNLTLNTEIQTLNMAGMGTVGYGVAHYAVDKDYFVWNSGSPQTFRHQFATEVTVSAQTGNLAPGYCIIANRLGEKSFVATQPGGYLYQMRLARFTDTQEISNKITLLDPLRGSEPLSIAAFACAGQTGYIATQDGRLFDLNLYNNTPTLEEPLISGEQFNLLQFSPPYLVWVDRDGDIKMYNVETKQPPVLAINVDPIQRATSRVSDLRIFGSIVVWSDDSEGNFDLWAADLATMQNENDYRQVTNHPSDQTFPFIHGNKLYWQDNRNGLAEIWSGPLPSFETK